MNIISCHGFVNSTKSAIILSCRRKLIDYYLQKCFVLIKNNSNSFKNVPLCVKKIINAENLYKNYLLIPCYRAIPSADNTLKIITTYNRLHTEFESTYYNDKGDTFIYLFGKYIKPYMK